MEDVARPAGGPGRARLAWIAALLYAGLIFFLSSIPSAKLPRSFNGADKLVHFAEYGVLGVLLALALGRRAGGWLIVGVAIALAVGYGASDEWHQSFVPGRQVSFWDLVADTAGASAGILAVLRPWRRGRPGS